MATKSVTIGHTPIGGGAPVTVQSMTTTDTRDAQATLAQIRRLFGAGCEIVRCAVHDMDCARAIRKIVEGSPIPVVADVHFDHRLGIAAVENGVHKLRINPGNIGGEAHVAAVAACCTAHRVPIRIGVNSGSIERDLLAKYGGPTPEAMAESALTHAAMLERQGFSDIVLSLKASSPRATVEACRALAKACDYPQHVGITETGIPERGVIQSAVGIGTLLMEGIGDTIRVSLTGDPVAEVTTGLAILSACGLRAVGVEVISCPTCGRTGIDVEGIAREVGRRTARYTKPLKVAVMGCVVNGPGEAREADLGIAGGNDGGALFVRGQMVRKVANDEMIPALLAEIEKMQGDAAV